MCLKLLYPNNTPMCDNKNASLSHDIFLTIYKGRIERSG